MEGLVQIVTKGSHVVSSSFFLLTFNIKKANAFLMACLVGVVLLTNSSTISAHRFEWYDGVWAHEDTILSPDPHMTFGRLSNGLRWVLYPSDSQPNHISVVLNVQAGALMEQEHESGAAHFLVHLAKEGSDTSNQTSLTSNVLLPTHDFHTEIKNEATIYRLDIQHERPENLLNGLRMLRNVADRLPITEKAIRSVKSGFYSCVPLQNEAKKDINSQWRRFLYEGTRLTISPNGNPEIIHNISRNTLEKFYKKWYVPGRMQVVIVGNIAPQTAEKLVKKTFGDMKAKRLAYPEDTGTPHLQGVKAFVRNVPEMTSTKISINILAPLWPVMATKHQYRYRICEDLFRIAIQRRLDKLTESDPDRWVEATFTSNRYDPPQPVISFKVTTVGHDWKKALKTLGREFVSIKKDGITQSEFDDVKMAAAIYLRRQFEEKDFLTHTSIANRIVNDINDNRITFSAEQKLDLYLATLRSLNLEELNYVYKSVMNIPNRILHVVGNNDANEEEVISLWNAIEKERSVVHVTNPKIDFPYLEEPRFVPPSFAMEPREIQVGEFNFYLWEGYLLNGTRVIFQPLNFQNGRVHIDLLYGDGLHGINQKDTYLPLMAVHTLAQAGIGRLSKTNSSMLFRARGIKVRESVDNYFNRISGESQSSNFDLLLKAIWTQFQDPFITEKNYRLALNLIRANEEKVLNSARNIAKYEKIHYFAGFDPIVLHLRRQNVQSIKIEDLISYIKSVRGRGERILYISGDFNLTFAAELVAKLFGSLPMPQADDNEFDVQMNFPSVQRQVKTIERDYSGFGNVSVGWRADLSAVNNRNEVVARKMISKLLSKKLINKLKAQNLLGTETSVKYYKFTDYGGFGYLLISVDGRNEDLEKIEFNIYEAVEEFKSKGVTAEDVEGLRDGCESNWSSKLYTNDFWSFVSLNTLVGDAQNFEWVEKTSPLIQSITHKEINQEIKKIFSSTKATLLLKSNPDSRSF